MPPTNRSSSYPLCLFVGALLIIVAAALHPHLSGGGVDELNAIGRSSGWQAVHWAFLAGFVLSLTGLGGIVHSYNGTTGEEAMRAGVIVMTFAYGAWMVVVTFMLGAGWKLAQNYVLPEAGMTSAHAVFVYDMVRPFALAAQRTAAFALGVATYQLGRGLLRASVEQRWLGWGGIASGLVAAALAILFGEATKADQVAFAPPVLWQLVLAGVLMARRPIAP